MADEKDMAKLANVEPAAEAVLDRLSPPSLAEKWKAGFASAKIGAFEAGRQLAVDTNYMDRSPEGKERRRALADDGHAVVGTLLHAGVSSAIGYALGGPVLAVAMPLLNAALSHVVSTLTLAAVPMAAGGALKLGELGAGMVEKLQGKRALAAAVEPAPRGQVSP
jgi:hypothetical protein